MRTSKQVYNKPPPSHMCDWRQTNRQTDIVITYSPLPTSWGTGLMCVCVYEMYTPLYVMTVNDSGTLHNLLRSCSKKYFQYGDRSPC